MVRALFGLILLTMTGAGATAQTLSNDLIGAWSTFIPGDPAQSMTIGVEKLGGPGQAGYLIYSGEVSCGAGVRITAFDESKIVFQAITESKGVRIGRDYYGKCSHAIRERGGIFGRAYGWELDNDEWRVAFNLKTGEMELYFDGRFVGKGPLQKISDKP